jgi:GNAT superfamily N-acetyltransferase
LTDVINRIPGVVEVLGPSTLFFAVDALAPTPGRHVGLASPGDVDDLLAAVPPDEAQESGLLEVTSTVFVTKGDDGSVIAACGYRHWPQNIAHLCVLAHPTHRGEGAGRAVAARAISHALEEKLLPQWRARPEASRALARALGLTELGDQLSLLIRDDR